MNASVGQMLKEARTKRNLGLREVTSLLTEQGHKISYVTLYRAEIDRSKLNYDDLSALISFYDLNERIVWRAFIDTFGQSALRRFLMGAIDGNKTDAVRKLLEMLEAA